MDAPVKSRRPTAHDLWRKLPKDLQELALEVFDMGLHAGIKRLLWAAYEAGRRDERSAREAQ